MAAIRSHFKATPTYPSSHIIPFSSERKWGAMFLDSIGTVALGAPEKLIKGNYPPIVEIAQQNGKRVLMMAVSQEKMDESQQLPTNLIPIGVLTINDSVRENANETLSYLHKEGIDIKVISGDNAVTVSNVAKQAGLAGYENFIDLSTVKNEEDVRKAASQYAVFGRVSPHQKKLLVQELKSLGRTVAMTGDGVNDILALREADVSIAMAEGDSATRQISNLVLLNSNFTTLPDVLFEGRRVVNNVTKVAGVFFIKTIYSFILSMICLATALPFPFIPIQITLLDLAIEGYPSFFLSFEGDNRKVNRNFLKNSLRRALPFSLLIIVNLIVIYLYGEANSLSLIEVNTLMYYMLIGVSVLAVVKACLPLNPFRAFLAVTTAVGTYLAAILFHHLLEIQLLTAKTFPLFAILMLSTTIISILINFILKKKV
jgi:cation-transporting ATPase E